MSGERDLRADRILFGQVLTLDGAGTRAEAVAVRAGRILAVGDRSTVEALRGPQTRVTDFGDAAIVPGFNDAHAHMDTEGLKHRLPSLDGARSIEEIQRRIGALADQTPKGEWVVTMPVGTPPFFFDGPNALREGRMPTRDELDRVAPDNPVCIMAPSGYWGPPPHHTALNSEALRRNGIGPDTQVRVSGVELARDADGRPTGVIADHNFAESAQLDLLPAVPRFTREDRLDAVRDAIRRYHAKGTTSVYEGHGVAPELIGIYRQLWEQGELTMRVALVVSPVWSSVAEADRMMRDWLSHARGRGFGDPMLTIAGVHIAYGGGDPAAAELSQANPADLGWWGFVRQSNDPREFEELCALAAEHDLRMNTIVIDRLEDVVPILERLHERYDLRGRRWVLQHMSIARIEDMRRLKALGVGVTLIPDYHLWKVGTRFFDLSDEDCERVAPLGILNELGVPVAAGTDNTPYNPLAVVRAMVGRRERTTGRVLGSAARVSPEAALRAMTVAGAWLTYEEDRKGPLCEGNFADLAVLSHDPLALSDDGFEQAACLATMVGGEFVHGDPD